MILIKVERVPPPNREQGSRSICSVEDESALLRRSLGINTTELPPDPILEHVLRLSQSVYAGELSLGRSMGESLDN